MMKEVAGARDVTVVFPAAGAGRRVGGERKQFRLLGDAPLLVQTLRAFDRHPSVLDLIVVCPSDEVESVQRSLPAFGLMRPVRVLPGGDSRQESVRIGLLAVAQETPVVLIHDAVRPFISEREISEVVARVRECGAAALAIPSTDTLRRVSDGLFGQTVLREGLYRMQTPQGFKRTLIIEAHRAAERSAVPATDDVDLAQMAGHVVYLVSGSSDNFKITTPDDWRRAELLWDSWREVHRR